MPLKGRANLFADDTLVIYNGTSNKTNNENLQYDLGIIYEYFRINKLTLNLKKTKIVNFHSGRKSEAAIDTVAYNGVTIEHVDSIKYLGVTIDGQLSWKQHIHNLSNKLASVIGVFTKMRKVLPNKIMKLLYHSLIHSRIDYAALSYATVHQTHIQRIQVLQNRALKRCYRLNNRFSTDDLYRTVTKDIIPIRLMQRYQACLFVHNATNHKIRTNISFSIKTNAHNTRKGVRLDTLRPRNWHGQCAISYTGPSYFNELNDETKNCKNEFKFKKLLKIEIMKLVNVVL